MSRKRARTDVSQDIPALEERLRSVVDPDFDREQIDQLIQQYQSSEAESAESTCELVCCPRDYEESFLREPVGSERACSRGRDCEGLKLLVDTPFVLREFIYPGSTSTSGRSLCLLCRRDEISRAHYRYETGHSKVASNVRITDHYNLVGVPGEYDVRDCIVSSGKYCGIPLPVVLHVRSAYTSKVEDGVLCLKQSRMRYPEHDDSSNSGSFLMRRATLLKKVARSNPHQLVKSN